LVHRDVKPQNLLLREDGILKIADFGIARAAEISRLTKLGTVLGTASYLAPEQALGEEVGPQADIYSLGAVLYELLTGRPPYEFSSLAELAEKQRTGSIVPVRDVEPAVPDWLEAIVMRCLARNPRFRPSAAAELADELVENSATTELPLPAAPTMPLPARVSRRIPEQSAWLWIALAGERELNVLARLVDPPLDRRERDLQRVRDLRVREADDVAEQQRHLQVDVQAPDRAPDGVDRFQSLERRVDDLERRDVLQSDE